MCRMKENLFYGLWLGVVIQYQYSVCVVLQMQDKAERFTVHPLPPIIESEWLSESRKD